MMAANVAASGAPRANQRDWERNRIGNLAGHVNGNGKNGHTKSAPPIDWADRAAGYAEALTPELRHELAETLGLPEVVLESMPLLGWVAGEEVWSFTECDHAGNIIGLTRRFRDGDKKAMPGAQRGLTSLAGWNRGGPVLAGEGASDTFTHHAMGLSSIGRPSNTGGADVLAQKLADHPTEHPIIVVGENDARDTGSWPGRDGAVSTATQLAKRLPKHTVAWALTPDGYKDSRKWALARIKNREDLDEWHQAGQEFLAKLMAPARLHIVKPPAEADDGAFPDAIPLSELQVENEDCRWVWEGFLALGGITLMSALWKAGKSTLLGHLLKHLGIEESEFLGIPTRGVNIIYVTEESKRDWILRRDAIGIGDHVHIINKPFKLKPNMTRWVAFISHLGREVDRTGAELLVIDTISAAWPIADENDAAQVQAALMPLNILSEKVAILLVHHHRKSDGQETTGIRGSGALAAFVDCIVELRRFDPGDQENRARVLTSIGRWSATPPEIVAEMLPDDSGFFTQGTRRDVRQRHLQDVVLDHLSEEWQSADEVLELIPKGEKPRRPDLVAALKSGANRGAWLMQGRGVRSDPHQFKLK